MKRVFVFLVAFFAASDSRAEQNPESIKVGTELTLSYSNAFRSWVNVRVYKGLDERDLNFWEDYAIFPDGNRATVPFRTLYYDDARRLVEVQELNRKFVYEPHFCVYEPGFCATNETVTIEGQHTVSKLERTNTQTATAIVSVTGSRVGEFSFDEFNLPILVKWSESGQVMLEIKRTGFSVP